MDIRPVESEADYDEALSAIDGLMGAAPGSPESDALKVLIALVDAYETRRWPVDPPDPISLIEHVMEARGYGRKDLAALLGSSLRASDVLKRRLSLTLPMIRALASEWRLPADVLVREYELAGRRSVSRNLRATRGRREGRRGHGAASGEYMQPRRQAAGSSTRSAPWRR